MIDKNNFERIKYEHGEYASWAIWADQGEKPKSNIGDLSVLDPETNTELLTLLKPEIIFVALNFSRGEGVKKPFSNFQVISTLQFMTYNLNFKVFPSNLN